MTDLDTDHMSLYSTAAYSSADQLMRDTGITNIIPGVFLDAKIFEPCGFSVNAIIKVRTHHCMKVRNKPHPFPPLDDAGGYI